jgi:hypothetical protein
MLILEHLQLIGEVMAESTVLDFSDVNTPPPDDPVLAPYGFRYDKESSAWVPKRSAGGRPPKNPREAPPQAPEEPQGKKDPESAWRSPDAPKAPASPLVVSAQTKKDMKAAVGLIFAVTGPAVMRVDPYCGTALTENLKPIADAVVPLLCESEMVVSFFQNAGGSNFMLWFALITAVFPVAQAFAQHHLTKTVQVMQDGNGNMFAVHRDENGNFPVPETQPEPEEPDTPGTRRGPAGFASYGV